MALFENLSNTEIVVLTVISIFSIHFAINRLLSLRRSNLHSSSQHGANHLNSAHLSSASDPTDSIDQRDFVKKLELQKKKIVVFYGSQTGTAEDFATRFAKEAKSMFGLSSLVADPDDYDFENLDRLTSSQLAVFVVATYGEGEPTDNAVAMYDYLKTCELDLHELRYVIFALGNRTYEKFCAMGQMIDDELSKRGGKRIGELGMGDDDKSMEEDYLAWKDPVWEEIQKELGWEEGRGGDEADFKVTEIESNEVKATPPIDDSKVFRGELSGRALTGTRGVFDAKNPYPAPVLAARELFQNGCERNCVHFEFDVKDTGIRYQAGDHMAIWPVNPDLEVERLMKLLGLWEKRELGVEISSLDPMLAKVPFPSPASYDAIFRHYLDISSTVSRQLLSSLSKFAPTPESTRRLLDLGTNKEMYMEQVASLGLRLGEVLVKVSEDDRSTLVDDPELKQTRWEIPFDRIISGLPRLQPRFYSISSSPKLYPDSIHITAVVLKYTTGNRLIYGLGTNYLLNAKKFLHGEDANHHRPSLNDLDQENFVPKYSLQGPRGKHLDKETKALKIPVHVRRSNFRLPTSPKIPVIMIGPGTGIAPFRSFVQERVALARKTKAKFRENNQDRSESEALKDWTQMVLFYGCRREDQDFLYKEEWTDYAKELDGKFEMYTAISRRPGFEGKRKDYVQDLIRERKEMIKKMIIDQKGYLFICGDGKNMVKGVEEVLKETFENYGMDGIKELKFLKDRNRLLLDVWS